MIVIGMEGSPWSGRGRGKVGRCPFIPADLAHTRTQARLPSDLSLLLFISLSFFLPGDRLSGIEGFCSFRRRLPSERAAPVVVG